MAEESPLQFPTDYPVKVVGHTRAGFRLHIDAIVQKHVPDPDPDRGAERPSGNGNFIAVSYTIVARSREQVVALVTELSATEGVVMVI